MAPTKDTVSQHRTVTVDAVADVVTRGSDASQRINEDRQIPRELIDSMASQGLFRLLVPRSVGGEEIDLLDYLAVTQAITALSLIHI